MAKRSKPAPEVLDLAPVDEDRQQTAVDGGTILGFLEGIVPFFVGARELESRAMQSLSVARVLNEPKCADDDVRIQKFVQRTTLEKKAVELHWGITGVVHRFHRRLTAKRDIAIKALDEANAIGNRLHNGYLAAEKRRTDEENERRRLQAEAEARERQRVELERMEAEAIAKEEQAPGLSEREARFVELYATGRVLGPDAARQAGFRDPKSAGRLLAMPKIVEAIRLKTEAAAIRWQAEARARMPVVADYQEVKPDITKAAGAHDRTTRRAEIVDAEAFVKAALGGQLGIPASALMPSQPGLNALARELGPLLNRWPGIKYVEDTKVV